MSDEAGRFVWYDLMTTDKAAAQAFYSELLGWNIRDVDMGPMGKYSMAHVGETGLAGMVTLEKSHGMPSHWIAYISVDDVDEAARRATRLGGKVAVEPMEIPGVGRFAVVGDPQGAYFSPFKGMSPEMPMRDGKPAPGVFCWNELLTSDPEAAAKFYGEIIGWSAGTQDMGAFGTYWVYKRGEQMAAGMMKSPPDAKHPPFWLPYVMVDNADATTARAKQLGAQVLAEPSDIPNMGRFAVISDPTGATIAVYQER